MKERTYDYWHKKMQLEERVAAYNEHLSRDDQPIEWLMENLKEGEKDDALRGIEQLQAELDKYDEEAGNPITDEEDKQWP